MRHGTATVNDACHAERVILRQHISAAPLIRSYALLDGNGDIVAVLSGRNADEEQFRDWIA